MENYLKHYGVLGMKWGTVRSKLALARARLDRNKSEDAKTKRSLGRKKLSSLSNKELKQLNERMQLEQNFKRLKREQISEGQKRAERILGKIGDKLLNAAIDEATRRSMDRVMNRG